MDGDGPLAQGDVGTRQRSTGLDTEVAAAVAAPVRYRRVAGLARAGAAALPAVPPVRPLECLEPLHGGFFRGKQVHHLYEAQALTEVPAGAASAICHLPATEAQTAGSHGGCQLFDISPFLKLRSGTVTGDATSDVH